MSGKVLIVDDHEAARLGISAALGDFGCSVAGFAENGKEALSRLPELVVDVVVMDVRMPEGDGLAALQSIRAAHEDLPIILLSSYDNPTYIARAAALGAYDYVLKNGVTSKLCESLTCALHGHAPPAGSRLSEIRNKLKRPVDSRKLPVELRLTGRESQVLVHVALGLSNKEIAKSLVISVETVKEHVQNVLRKMKANDRTDAAVRAMRLGLVD